MIDCKQAMTHNINSISPQNVDIDVIIDGYMRGQIWKCKKGGGLTTQLNRLLRVPENRRLNAS